MADLERRTGQDKIRGLGKRDYKLNKGKWILIFGELQNY